MANASCWAVVKAKGAPVEEMQACAAACASWLMLHGFFTNPFDDGYGPTVPPPDVITRLLPSVDDDVTTGVTEHHFRQITGAPGASSGTGVWR